jgi:hypothetical protein
MEAVAHSELAKLSLDLKGLNAKPLWERISRRRQPAAKGGWQGQA